MSAENLHLLGGGAALASALLWAMSAMLFQQVGRHVSASAMNLFKGIVAILCMGVLLLPSGIAEMGISSAVYLALSGLVGICLGDTLYFLTINRLGARLTLLISSLIPVVTALFAALLLGERIDAVAWLGLFLTITGVTFVLWERTVGSPGFMQWRMGLVLGVLFVLANALGIIFTKVGVQSLPALDATFIRTVWAVAGLTFWGLACRSLFNWWGPLKDRATFNRLLLASVIGAFVGTWLSIVALKYTHVAVAVTLNSTSPLFILPIAAWVLKERISVRAVSGALVAVGGIALYFFNLTEGL
ncbi:MAG: DMT family transporter [Gammaproteobacteria bacterium]|nr:DMT family transporter [Gammaproteobacteria bacterium]